MNVRKLRVGALAVVLGLAGCHEDGDVSVTVLEFRADRMALAPGELVTLTWEIDPQAHIELLTGVTLFRGVPDEQGTFAEDSDLIGEFGKTEGAFVCVYNTRRELSCFDEDDSNGTGPTQRFSLPAGPQDFTIRACSLGLDGSAQAKTHRACDDRSVTLTFL